MLGTFASAAEWQSDVVRDHWSLARKLIKSLDFAFAIANIGSYDTAAAASDLFEPAVAAAVDTALVEMDSRTACFA